MKKLTKITFFTLPFALLFQRGCCTLHFSPGPGCGLSQEIKVMSKVQPGMAFSDLEDCALIIETEVLEELQFNTPGIYDGRRKFSLRKSFNFSFASILSHALDQVEWVLGNLRPRNTNQKRTMYQSWTGVTESIGGLPRLRQYKPRMSSGELSPPLAGGQSVWA